MFSIQSQVILIAGISVSLLLALLLIMLLKRNARIAIKAEESSTALMQNEAKFSSVFHAASEVMITLDKECLIEQWNPSAEKIFHLQQRDAHGKSLLKLLFDNLPALSFEFEQAVIHGQAIESRRVELRDANGEVMHMLLNLAPLTDQNQRHAGATLSLQNISHLVHSESKLNAIIQNILDGIITIDAHGLIESINPAAQKIFGYSAEEVLGENIQIFMPPTHQGKHDEYIRQHIGGSVAHIIGVSGRQLQGVRKNGELFPLEIAVSQLDIEHGHIFVGVVRDLSENKK